MELEDAIEHLDKLLEEKKFDCSECEEQHRQLRAWLIELLERRKNESSR